MHLFDCVTKGNSFGHSKVTYELLSLILEERLTFLEDFFLGWQCVLAECAFSRGD